MLLKILRFNCTHYSLVEFVAIITSLCIFSYAGCEVEVLLCSYIMIMLPLLLVLPLGLFLCQQTKFFSTIISLVLVLMTAPAQ